VRLGLRCCPGVGGCAVRSSRYGEGLPAGSRLARAEPGGCISLRAGRWAHTLLRLAGEEAVTKLLATIALGAASLGLVTQPAEAAKPPKQTSQRDPRTG
jgi:hypothetical protein